MKFLIDAGHGGMLFGRYMTAGKRSPSVPPGIYEGEFNRIVAAQLTYYMYDAIAINPGPIDIPLRARVNTINKIVASLDDDVVSVSIHANAAGRAGWSSASGFRVFYPFALWDADRRRKSKLLAECINSAFVSNHMIPYGERAPKRAKFTMIAKPRCPAVLVECGFMTNIYDADFMASRRGQSEITLSISRGLDLYKKELSNG